jgi:hypothetical protein
LKSIGNVFLPEHFRPEQYLWVRHKAAKAIFIRLENGFDPIALHDCLFFIFRSLTSAGFHLFSLLPFSNAEQCRANTGGKYI